MASLYHVPAWDIVLMRPETQKQSTEAQCRVHSDGAGGQAGVCCMREYGARENGILETEAIQGQDRAWQPDR